jgi:hypothetical protein
MIPVKPNMSYNIETKCFYNFVKDFDPNGRSTATGSFVAVREAETGVIEDGINYIYVRNPSSSFKFTIDGYPITFEKPYEGKLINVVLKNETNIEKLENDFNELSQSTENELHDLKIGNELFYNTMWDYGFREYELRTTQRKGYINTLNKHEHVDNDNFQYVLLTVNEGEEFNITNAQFHGFLKSYSVESSVTIDSISYPTDTWTGTVPSGATLMYLGFSNSTSGVIGDIPFSFPIKKIEDSVDKRIKLLEEESAIKQKYYDRPEKGYENFSVQVNYAEYTDNTDDGNEVYTDYGVIALPKNYTPNGEATRLIIFCQGTGERINSGTNPMNNYGWEYFTSKGYAVMDMNGVAPQWGSDKGFPAPSQHYCTKHLLGSYAKGYHYVMEKYNLNKQVFILGLSMGGGASALIVQSGIIPIIAHGAFCPAFSVFKQNYLKPWGGENQQKQIAGQWGFADWENTAPSMEYFLANIDKIKGFDNLLIKTIGDHEKANSNFGNDAEAEAYNSMVKFYPVPLKIWHCVDDGTVSIRYSRFMVNMIKNGGGQAWLREFEGGSHYLGWTIGSVTDVDIDGEEITTSIPFYESIKFFERFA